MNNEKTRQTELFGEIYKLNYDKPHYQNGFPKLELENKRKALHIKNFLREYYRFVDSSDTVIPKSSRIGKHYICGFEFEKLTGYCLPDEI